MTTNKLYYTISKIYAQARTTFKINVEILLADGNWSIISLFTRNAKTVVSLCVLVVVAMRKL